jgi:nucleobase:cation symporter-1, NCS1 family
MVRAVRSRVATALEVKHSQTEITGSQSYGKWSNKDLEPTPPVQRNWSGWYFFAFQFSIAFSPTTYNIGSSLYAVGLNWWLITISSFVGTGLCCMVLFLNSRGPSWYHIGFPVYMRASAGVYGSLWFIFLRMAVAMFVSTMLPQRV